MARFKGRRGRAHSVTRSGETCCLTAPWLAESRRLWALSLQAIPEGRSRFFASLSETFQCPQIYSSVVAL
jgi:hypothetical protein